MTKLSVAIAPLLLSISCAEKPQATPAAKAAAESASQSASRVPNMAAVAPPAPGAAVTPQPIAPALREACDTVQAVMRQVLGVPPRREDGSYEDGFHGERRVGCRLTAMVEEKVAPVAPVAPVMPGASEPPPPGIPERLEERGWAQDLRYMSDGPDGGSVGLRRRDLLCMVRTDGPHDDDDDTTRVRSAVDSITYVVECAHDVPSNGDGSVPDSLWQVARAQGLDSLYAIDLRLQYPPYRTGDFDGDGVNDAVVLVNERATGKLGLAFVLRGARRVVIVGAGKAIGGRDDFVGVTGWETFAPGISFVSGVPFIPSQPQTSEAVWLQFRDSTSGFVEWNGASYAWDPGRRIRN